MIAGKILIVLTALGALFSLGYGQCDYRSVPYQSSGGTVWYINLYVKQSTNQACLEDPHVLHSCSSYGGCSYPFYGVSVCFDDNLNKPCVGQNSNGYQISTYYDCSSSLGCTQEQAYEAGGRQAYGQKGSGRGYEAGGRQAYREKGAGRGYANTY